MRFSVVNIHQAGKTRKGNSYFIVSLQNLDTQELIDNVYVFKNKVTIAETFEGEIQLIKTDKGTELKKLQIKQSTSSSKMNEVIDKLNKILTLLEEIKANNA